MPKPNIIPEPNWRAIFAAANTYDQWLARGEYPKDLEAMEALRKNQILGPDASEFLARLDRTVNVLVMAEDWCPDVGIEEVSSVVVELIVPDGGEGEGEGEGPQCSASGIGVRGLEVHATDGAMLVMLAAALPFLSLRP